MDGHFQSDLIFSQKGRCCSNRILARIGEIDIPRLHSLCALAFHNGWEDSNMDAPITLLRHIKLVNFGPGSADWRL